MFVFYLFFFHSPHLFFSSVYPVAAEKALDQQESMAQTTPQVSASHGQITDPWNKWPRFMEENQCFLNPLKMDLDVQQTESCLSIFCAAIITRRSDLTQNATLCKTTVMSTDAGLQGAYTHTNTRRIKWKLANAFTKRNQKLLNSILQHSLAMLLWKRGEKIYIREMV